jgi:hypothetical protein
LIKPRKEEKKMKRKGLSIIFGILFVITMAYLSYAAETKSKQIQPAAPATTSPKIERPPVTPMIHDLEAKMPVCTRRPISGGVGVFILRGTVCNIGTVDHVSPPHETAYVELAAVQPGHPRDRRTVLVSQRVTNLKKGQCINLDATYKISGILRWGSVPVRTEEVKPGECKDEVSFWITIGRDPATPGRTFAYDYPDANRGNNIAGQTMEYIITCPR